MNKQNGFTLIEMLTTLVLGSIISMAVYATMVQSQLAHARNSAHFDVEKMTNRIRLAMTQPAVDASTNSVCQQTMLFDEKSGSQNFPNVPTTDASLKINRIYGPNGTTIADLVTDNAKSGLVGIELVPLLDDDVARSSDHSYDTEMVLSFRADDMQIRTRSIPLRFRTNNSNQIIDCMSGIQRNGGTDTAAATKKFGSCPPGQVANDIDNDGHLICTLPIVQKQETIEVGCEHPKFAGLPQCQAPPPPPPPPPPIAPTTQPSQGDQPVVPTSPDQPPAPQPANCTPIPGTWQWGLGNPTIRMSCPGAMFGGRSVESPLGVACNVPYASCSNMRGEGISAGLTFDNYHCTATLPPGCGPEPSY